MDEQNEQNEHQNLQLELNPAQRSAVGMRLIGLKYSVIAENLTRAGYKVKEHTIRVWFIRGNVCHQSLDAIRKQRMAIYDDFHSDMKYQLREAALDAFGVLNRAVVGEKVKPSQIRAAQLILDIAGFPREKGFVYTTRYDTSKEDIEQIAHKVKELIKNTSTQTSLT